MPGSGLPRASAQRHASSDPPTSSVYRASVSPNQPNCSTRPIVAKAAAADIAPNGASNVRL